MLPVKFTMGKWGFAAGMFAELCMVDFQWLRLRAHFIERIKVKSCWQWDTVSWLLIKLLVSFASLKSSPSPLPESKWLIWHLTHTWIARYLACMALSYMFQATLNLSSEMKKKFQHAGLRLKIAMAETPEECSLLLRQEQNPGVDAHHLSERGGKIGGYRPLLFLSICRVQRTLNSTCMCAYLMQHVLSMKTKTWPNLFVLKRFRKLLPSWKGSTLTCLNEIDWFTTTSTVIGLFQDP